MASFSSAFAAARKAKGAGATFEWNGKTYSTNRADDKPPSKGAAAAPKPKPRPVTATASATGGVGGGAQDGTVAPPKQAPKKTAGKGMVPKPAPKITSTKDPAYKKAFADMRAKSPVGKAVTAVKAAVSNGAADRVTAAKARAAAAKKASAKK